MKYIAVIGEGTCSPETGMLAYRVGSAIARKDAVLINGGLGGVMEWSARGAREAGGRVVGLLPGDTRHGANPYLDVSIPTGLGEARNALVVRSAEAVIAVGGGFGTLSELAYALKWGHPVVGLDTWELSRPGFESVPIHRATNPDEAVEKAFHLLGEE